MRGRAFFFSCLVTSFTVIACSGSAVTDILGGDSDAASDARAGGNSGDGSSGGLDGALAGDSNGGGNDGGGGNGNDAQSGMDSGGGTCPIPPGGMLGDGAIMCSGLAISGTPLTTTCHNGSAPMPTGGTVVDGFYVLDQLDYYGDPGQCPTSQERVVWQVCGSSWASVQEHDLATYYYSTTVVPTPGTPGSITLNVTCPMTTTVTDGYIATPTSLTLFINFGNNAIRLDRFKRM
jgi:hypothetical protein